MYICNTYIYNVSIKSMKYMHIYISRRYIHIDDNTLYIYIYIYIYEHN